MDRKEFLGLLLSPFLLKGSEKDKIVIDSSPTIEIGSSDENPFSFKKEVVDGWKDITPNNDIIVDGDLTIDTTPNDSLYISDSNNTFSWNQYHYDPLVINDDNNEEILAVKADGTLVVHDETKLDEAGEKFCEFVEQFMKPRKEMQAEIDTLKEQLGTK